jgi:hypothetical protein
MNICSYRAGLLAYEGFNRVLELFGYSMAYWPFALMFWLIALWTLRAFYLLSTRWSLRAALNLSMSLGVMYLLSPLAISLYGAFLLAILFRLLLEEKKIYQALFRGFFESFVILFPAVILMNFHVVSCSIQSSNSLWGNWLIAKQMVEELYRSFFAHYSWLTIFILGVFWLLARVDPWRWGSPRLVTAFLTVMVLSLVLYEFQVIPGAHVP